MNPIQPPSRPIRRPSLSNNNSEMSSSTGFKTCTKIKTGTPFRPPSRDLLKSEIMPQQLLQSIPLETQDTTFCSSIKAELIKIQDVIDSMDIDKKLRNGNNSNISHPHIATIKKWVALQASEIPIAKQLDIKLQQVTDLDRVIETLGMDDLKSAFNKTLKMVTANDFLVLKMNELQCIHFLQYGPLIQEYSQQTKELIERISQQGSQTGKLIHLLPQVNLSLNCDFIQQFNKQKPKLQPQTIQFDELIKDNNKIANLLQQRDDEVVRLTRQLGEARESILVLSQLQAQQQNQLRNTVQSEQRFRQSQEKNRYLEEEKKKLIDQLSSQVAYLIIFPIRIQWQINLFSVWEEVNLISVLTLTLIQNTSQKQLTSLEGHTVSQLKINLQYLYQYLYLTVQQEICYLKQLITEQQIKSEHCKIQLQEVNKKAEILKELKDDLFKRFQQKYSNQEDYEQSYEAALQAENNRMQNGFQNRILDLMQENEQIKKDQAKFLNDSKKELDKEADKSRILLKKLSIFLKI